MTGLDDCAAVRPLTCSSVLHTSSRCQDQAMVGYELIQTTGNATATYKFTPKYVLKAGQKVAVRVDFAVVVLGKKA